MVTRAEWIAAFLAEGEGFPDTPENVIAVLTWIRSEWGNAAPVHATWNPLNTTLSLPPQSDYNSVGVKNYESFGQGVTANARTLALSYYPAIRAALHAGNNANSTINAIRESPWGSKPNAGTLAYVRANLAADKALTVGVGTAPVPHPPSPPGVNMKWYLVACPIGDGYWWVNSLGQVYAYGHAQFHGGRDHMPHPGDTFNGDVIGLAPTHDGGGYWLGTDKASAYAFGNATAYGDPHP